jgi:hypothetical protein
MRVVYNVCVGSGSSMGSPHDIEPAMAKKKHPSKASGTPGFPFMNHGGKRNGAGRKAKRHADGSRVDGGLVPLLGGMGVARRADADPGVGSEARAVLPDEARFRRRAPVVRGADAQCVVHAAAKVPGAR